MKKKNHSKPITPKEWAAYIEKERKATCKAYLAKPAFLLGHSQDEQQTTEGYAGRELLELVQNAADAAAEVDGLGKVLIEVTHECLYVANSGQPFRKSGVSSLMTAHTSDKLTRAVRMIGAKGLGFRAILNWTESPLISSGALEIGFSRDHSMEELTDLSQQSPEIAKQLEGANTAPPPLLIFPIVGHALEAKLDPETNEILDHVRTLREEGYDTVVAAPFRNQRGYEKAIEQTREFEPTFLLFVKSLNEIRIQLPNEQERFWYTETDEKEGDVTIHLGRGADTETQTWILRQKQGTLGIDDAECDYELAIALSRDEICKAGYLHSFFPTSLSLPFTALFHATLELDSTRKTIKDDSDHNDAVLRELGRFYAEVLHELREGGRLGSDPLYWLVADGEFPDSLETLAEEAWLRARELPLVRGLDGAWRSVADSLIGPGDYGQYLPQRLFGELAAVDGYKVEKLLRDQLKVAEIAPSKIIKRLKCAKLNIDERARAIVGIAAYLLDEHHDRRLFLDTKQNPMPEKAIIFPPPDRENQRLDLPRWSSVRFIHPKLWKKIVEQAENSKPREIIPSLEGFRVREYNVESVIQALRVRLREHLEANHNNPDRLQAEFLDTLYKLHDRKHQKPNGIVRVKCKDGSWQDIRSVHLSEAYSQSGRINAALYSTHPELLIGDPTDNGLSPEADDLADFLLWLGINEWPRQVEEPLPEEWQQPVLQALPETILVSDCINSQTLQRDALKWEHTLKGTYGTIPELNDIFANAPSEAILAWLSQDDRMDALSHDSEFQVALKGRRNASSAFRPYNGTLPDILRQIIKRSKWLTCTDEKLHAPQDAMISPGNLDTLFQAPQPPSASSKKNFGLSSPFWIRGLVRAGVVRDLGDIPEDQVYRILLDLPSRCAPKLASRFLLQILERESFNPEYGGADREHYLQEGQVPIQAKSGSDWGARDGAYYANRDDLPAAVRNHLTLVDLPTRRNATQVEKRFGIPTLHKAKLNVRLQTVDREVGLAVDELTDRFEKAKPYILALRNQFSPEQRPLLRMESLKLSVARHVKMELKIGDRTVIDKLEPFKHSLNIQDNQLTVTIDPRRPDKENIDLGLHAISDGISELFELQGSGDFTSILTATTDELRMAHLERALPGLTDEELDAVKSGVGYVKTKRANITVDPDTLAQANEKTTVAKATKQVLPEAEQPERTDSGEVKINTDDEGDDERTDIKLIATERSVDQSREPSRDVAQKTTVRITIGTGSLAGHNADVDRAADAETWALAFERSQGRIPHSVANLIGSGAFGCDCLSFKTDEDLESFKKNPQKLDLVERFIETKSGRVLFTQNEWMRAKEFGDRYFVYRIKFPPGRRDQADLRVVKNPSESTSEALQVSYELLVEQAAYKAYTLEPDNDADVCDDE